MLTGFVLFLNSFGLLLLFFLCVGAGWSKWRPSVHG